jgi:hypothetical protein
VSFDTIQIIPGPNQQPADRFSGNCGPLCAAGSLTGPAMGIGQAHPIGQPESLDGRTRALLKIRSLVRSHTRIAVRVLVGFMRSEDAAPAALASNRGLLRQSSLDGCAGWLGPLRKFKPKYSSLIRTCGNGSHQSSQ